MPNYLRHLIKIGLGPFIIFIINYPLYSSFLNWYETNHIDIYMHLAGGLSAGWSINYALKLLEHHKKLIINHFLLRWLIIICGVMSIAVLWEFYEFISDYFYKTQHQPNPFDTMKDLFNGMLGAIITCLLFVRNRK